ncbi:hypothetical protein [Candidatus Thiosymbion oneisti]|uniref:hypothetical protein n=1 Tax=Candidatus Thiosymbion oneisti TaxID=589554 RepID=UPI0013FE41E3|nr:hypothetical protein [Candidatus Thiosymbion oneisti]
MITRNRTINHIIVLLILALVVAIAAWSRLRYVEESDHEPRRIPLYKHPDFEHPASRKGPS